MLGIVWISNHHTSVLCIKGTKGIKSNYINLLKYMLNTPRGLWILKINWISGVLGTDSIIATAQRVLIVKNSAKTL